MGVSFGGKDRWCRQIARRDAHPDQLIALDRIKPPRPMTYRWLPLRQRWHGRHLAIAGKAPTVVRAFEFAFMYSPERQPRAPMGALIGECADQAGCVTPQYKVLAKQPGRAGLRGHRAAVGNRMPECLLNQRQTWPKYRPGQRDTVAFPCLALVLLGCGNRPIDTLDQKIHHAFELVVSGNIFGQHFFTGIID